MLFHWSHLRLDFYCFLHPLPFLLGETPQDNFWLSCPTVPEIGGRAESLNGQQTSREERCHFPFWHQGRLRYECVELDTTSSSSSSQVFPCFSSMILIYVCYLTANFLINHQNYDLRQFLFSGRFILVRNTSWAWNIISNWYEGKFLID